MRIRLRTRADLKAAGRAFAEEHALLLARHLLTWSEAELRDDARVDAAITRILNSMWQVAESYLQQGIPEPHVRAFCRSFVRTAGERFKDVGFVAGMNIERHRLLAGADLSTSLH